MSFPEGLKRPAVLCILYHHDQYLLLKRIKPPHQGRYTPVGGKIDPHESPKDAAIRETWEETGIRVSHMRYAGILTETSPIKYNWILYVYVAEIPWQPAPPCDEGVLEWVNETDLVDLDSPETDLFIYQYIKEGKPFAFHATYDAEVNLLEMVDEIEEETVFSRN
ncbi:MAG: NUDIX domain-containing protein [Bacteroidota bacterium]